MSDNATPAAGSSGPACSEFRLPVVAGRRSEMSNAAFERACLVHIERLQHGIGLYDCAMMLKEDK